MKWEVVRRSSTEELLAEYLRPRWIDIRLSRKGDSAAREPSAQNAKMTANSSLYQSRNVQRHASSMSRRERAVSRKRHRVASTAYSSSDGATEARPGKLQAEFRAETNNDGHESMARRKPQPRAGYGGAWERLRHGGGEVGGGRHGRQLRASLLHKLRRDLQTKISFQFGAIRLKLIRSDWIHARTRREATGPEAPPLHRGKRCVDDQGKCTPMTAGRTVGAGP